MTLSLFTSQCTVLQLHFMARLVLRTVVLTGPPLSRDWARHCARDKAVLQTNYLHAQCSTYCNVSYAELEGSGRCRRAGSLLRFWSVT